MRTRARLEDDLDQRPFLFSEFSEFSCLIFENNSTVTDIVQFVFLNVTEFAKIVIHDDGFSAQFYVSKIFF
jgi:SPX domain protein involved in polyphosphate accumulation